MPYGKVVIQNAETGEVEEFLARISPQGVIDWLADRSSLRAAGHPDRPPDVDTETMRTWLPWPGEEDLPYFQRRREIEAEHMGGRPFTTVYAVAWHAIGLHAAFNLLAFIDEEGGYTAVLGSSDSDALPNVVKPYGRDEPDEVVWEEAEALVIEVTNTREWDEVRVTTTLDVDWFDSETTLAEAEIARGFQSLPEGPVN